MDLQKMTTEDLAREIAGPDTIAGGGSVSALAGAYGAALMSMVSRKTVQNKKYEPVRDEFLAMLERVQEPRETFLRGIQGDIDAFGEVEAALALPKTTDEEKAARRAAMDEGMIAAAEAPLRMAELAIECLTDFVTIVTKGNRNAWSDALAGVQMLRAAALGSVYNVRINLNPLAEREECREMLCRAAELEAEALAIEAFVADAAPEIAKPADEHRVKAFLLRKVRKGDQMKITEDYRELMDCNNLPERFRAGSFGLFEDEKETLREFVDNFFDAANRNGYVDLEDFTEFMDYIFLLQGTGEDHVENLLMEAFMKSAELGTSLRK